MKPRICVLGVAVLALAVSGFANAASAPIEVTACGQRIPSRHMAFLSADLTCTTGYGVILGRGATLDLRGFTLSGGLVGVVCLHPKCSPETCSRWSECEVRNGTITAPEQDPVVGRRVTIRNMTIVGNGRWGVIGFARIAVFDSHFLNAPWGVVASRVDVTGSTLDNTPVDATRVKLTSSTVTSNGQFGVIARSIELVDSHVVGNGTAAACGTALACADLVSDLRPKLDGTSTCDVSRAVTNGPNGTWGVCTLD